MITNIFNESALPLCEQYKAKIDKASSKEEKMKLVSEFYEQREQAFHKGQCMLDDGNLKHYIFVNLLAKGEIEIVGHCFKKDVYTTSVDGRGYFLCKVNKVLKVEEQHITIEGILVNYVNNKYDNVLVGETVFSLNDILTNECPLDKFNAELDIVLNKINTLRQ